MLNGSNNENLKFATKKWYVFDSESNGSYSLHNKIKFLTDSLESSLFNFFFLSGFCFPNIHESQDCKGRGRTFH